MAVIRPPAVAGKFYPDNSGDLLAALNQYLDAAPKCNSHPKALIVPHAGYPYSGPIAGAAYAKIANLRNTVSRVLLIGPAHFETLDGLAASSAEFFATPLADVPVDTAAVNELLKLPQVSIHDDAHREEHCLEVQLPFLQHLLDEFKIVPLLAGRVTMGKIATVIELFWDQPENLIVISSDLSHFYDYETATQLDRETSNAIKRLSAQEIDAEHACGFRAIQGLMQVAQDRGVRAEILDVRNSGDTSGARDRVVGYGAYAFE